MLASPPSEESKTVTALMLLHLRATWAEGPVRRKRRTNSCDPVRRTAWGTIVVGEESGNTGWLIEIINPLSTTNVSFNRAAGTFSGGDAGNLAVRPAVGRLSFEGLALYPNGLLYYGDENRPSTGTPGGAYFKFIPSSPWAGGTITNLSQSPLVAGTVYGLRLGKRSGNTDYGQGTNTGKGVWVPIEDTIKGFNMIMNGEVDKYPEAAFNLVGTIEDAIAKFAGLWWPENASGQFEAEERPLSKRGNDYLRYFTLLAADRMRLFIPSYARFYQTKYKQATKHHHKRALVLTGRKALGLFVGLLLHQEMYQPEEV